MVAAGALCCLVLLGDPAGPVNLERLILPRTRQAAAVLDRLNRPALTAAKVIAVWVPTPRGSLLVGKGCAIDEHGLSTRNADLLERFSNIASSHATARFNGPIEMLLVVAAHHYPTLRQQCARESLIKPFARQ